LHQDEGRDERPAGAEGAPPPEVAPTSGDGAEEGDCDDEQASTATISRRELVPNSSETTARSATS
jgi:hypothetical protein